MTNHRPYRLPPVTRPEPSYRAMTRCLAGVLLACLLTPAQPAGAKLIDLAFAAADHRLSGANAEDRSGAAVLFADVNGDNRDDLIVAAPEFDLTGRAACGAIFIVISSDTLPDTVGLDTERPDLKRIFGPLAGSRLGSVMACGDIDNDGHADIVCGIPGASPLGRFSAGELYVIFGSSAPADSVDLASASSGVMHVLGAAVFDKIGTAIAVGDVNDDTFGDILAGAPLASTTRSLTGKVVVIPGSSSPPASIDLAAGGASIARVFGQATNDYFGGAVHSADVTGDDVDDIIVGAPESSPLGRAQAGCAYIIPGSASLADTIDTIDAPAGGIKQIIGAQTQSATGSGFAVGDFDGDLVTELAVGASEFETNHGGAVYIMDRNGQWPDTLDLAGVNPPARLDGDESNANVGLHLAAGDFNLDGKDDLVIGAPRAKASVGRDESGKVYIVFGRPSFPPVLSLLPIQSGITTIYGADAHDRAGSSVASGRVGGTGFWDLLFGADQMDNPGELRAGAGLVFLGSGDITPTAILSYDATIVAEGVSLTWRLADPVDPTAIRIDRRAGDGSVKGFDGAEIRRSQTRYEFVDRTVVPATTYEYTVGRRDGDPQVFFAIRVTVPPRAAARLDPAFPNPFSTTATIPLWLPAAAVADVSVFDVTGARVRVLRQSRFPAGRTVLEWDGRDAAGRMTPSGVYFIRLRHGPEASYRKLLLLR